jgi:hypothetical protein
MEVFFYKDEDEEIDLREPKMKRKVQRANNK